MFNKLNIKRKRKGFTLIELVIVLAVLAIIALIAIPNFTKVRNDSLAKADARTAEEIENITLMAIANQDIIVPASGTEGSFTIGENTVITEVDAIDFGKNDSRLDSYKSMIKEVKKPQVNGQTLYKVIVKATGDVEVVYGDDSSITE